MAHVFFSEINVYGGVAVYGTIGVKQYYGYSKTAAEAKYKAEAEEKIFYNQGVKNNVKKTEPVTQ